MAGARAAVMARRGSRMSYHEDDTDEASHLQMDAEVARKAVGDLRDQLDDPTLDEVAREALEKKIKREQNHYVSRVQEARRLRAERDSSFKRPRGVVRRNSNEDWDERGTDALATHVTDQVNRLNVMAYSNPAAKITAKLELLDRINGGIVGANEPPTDVQGSDTSSSPPDAKPGRRSVTEEGRPGRRSVTEESKPGRRSVTEEVKPGRRSVTEEGKPGRRSVTEDGGAAGRRTGAQTAPRGSVTEGSVARGGAASRRATATEDASSTPGVSRPRGSVTEAAVARGGAASRRATATEEASSTSGVSR